MPKSSLLDSFDAKSFRYKQPIPFRWADLDGMGHTNNAIYLTYFEQIRILYARDVMKWDWELVGMILARTEIDYIHPLAHPQNVEVLARVIRCGSKSFDMEYAVADLSTSIPKIYAIAQSTLVGFDYKSQKSVVIPSAYREAAELFEPLPIEGLK
ncbi:MAG: acyl-CoA thioesterase [Sphingomonadales bacterium]|nr:acyl-CoA thioesterase [Sphingomonadales bacterium]